MAFSALWYQIGDTHSLIETRSAIEQRVAKLLSVPQASKALNELIQTLNGAAVGATASATDTRVKGDTSTFKSTINGGLRTMETKTYINRATTAADQTNLNALLQETYQPSSYPVDKSGNGGGGNLSRVR